MREPPLEIRAVFDGRHLRRRGAGMPGMAVVGAIARRGTRSVVRAAAVPRRRRIGGLLDPAPALEEAPEEEEPAAEEPVLEEEGASVESAVEAEPAVEAGEPAVEEEEEEEAQ